MSARITLLAATKFYEPPAHIPWSPDSSATGGEALAEFAGRACSTK
jgi:hypothetical protein